MSAQIKDTFRSFHLSPFFLLTLETYPVQLYLFNELSSNVSCTFECITPILLPSSSFSPIINCLLGPTISPVFKHFRLEAHCVWQKNKPELIHLHERKSTERTCLCIFPSVCCMELTGSNSRKANP